MLSLIIVSHEIAWLVDDVRDGLTHRYYGLYSNLARYVLGHGGTVFWYTAKECKLLTFDLNTYISSSTYSMFIAMVKALRASLTYGRPVIVLLDYPHSFLGAKHLMDYILTLLLFHVLRLVKRIYVVVDNMDPPIEHAIELKGGINLLQRLLWILLNNIIFGFDLIVFHSQSYRVYHKLYYRLDYSKSVVIPPGSFPEVIQYEDPPSNPPIRIFCSGKITEWVGLERLMKIVKKLKNRGIMVKFILIDRSAPTDLEQEDIKIIRTYIGYKDFIKTLAKAHLLLLTRPNSLHHLLTVRASLADYLMAGRPVLYLHSLGMREIVGNIDGVFEFRILDEVPEIILKLINDKNSLKKLSQKVRAFAERHLKYKVLALKLLREILTNLRQKLLHNT